MIWMRCPSTKSLQKSTLKAFLERSSCGCSRYQNGKLNGPELRCSTTSFSSMSTQKAERKVEAVVGATMMNQSMNMKTTTIGISVGTRSIGIAVLNKNELIDWRIMGFPEYWSKHKCAFIANTIKKYLDEYEPQKIAIKAPAQPQQSKQLRGLVTTLSTLIKKKQLPLYCYTLLDLKECFRCSNKEMLMLTITNHFPELAHTYKKVVRLKNGYYNKIFEAVAAAMLCTSISQK